MSQPVAYPGFRGSFPADPLIAGSNPGDWYFNFVTGLVMWFHNGSWNETPSGGSGGGGATQIEGNQSVVAPQDPTYDDLYFNIRYLGAVIDPRNIRALTSSDVVTAMAMQNGVWTVGRTWNLGSSDTPSLQDRNANQLVFDSSGYVGLGYEGAQIDPRAIRALTSSDQITVSNFPTTQAVSGAVAVSNTGFESLDEQGNLVQTTELLHLFREILYETRATRVLLQKWTQEDVDLIDFAKEEIDDEPEAG